jgi:LPXTG-motif cell wall-anchored protein
MAFTDDSDLDIQDVNEEGEEGGPPEQSSNRTFLLILLVGGALIVLTLVCMVFFFLQRSNQNRAARDTQVAMANEQSTQLALWAAQTAEAQAWTPTPTNTVPPPPASPTPVVALASSTPTSTSVAAAATLDPRTATVAAQLTGVPAGTQAGPTATALPNTGFIDDVGAPGLLGLAAVLLVLIVLARRLRLSGTG